MKAPQTELHRHLDVALRLETLLSLAQARGLEAQSTSLEVFREKVVLREQMTDLTTVLSQFSLFQKVLDRPEVLEQVAFEAVEDCYREGTRKAELRFAPSFVTEYNEMSWEDVLRGFERGISRARAVYPDIQIGLLCIAVRDHGVDEVSRAVDFFLARQDRFVGLDLAGSENFYPCRLFEEPFKKARAAKAKITIHAGEDSGPENIWEAIELLGARRIGHGISCVRDPQLLEHLAKHKICLEMCPTSNWLTHAVAEVSQHPLPKILAAGVPVSINTDDPAIFGVDLGAEIALCKSQMGLSTKDVERCMEYASNASFINAY